MKKILGIDLGEKRIGLAMAIDKVVLEYRTIINSNKQQVTREITDICQKENIEEIIVGLPKNMSGEEGEKAQQARDFAGELKEKIKIPIHLEDERLSSNEAERILKEQGLSIEEARKRVDALSAKLILEQYINK